MSLTARKVAFGCVHAVGDGDVAIGDDVGVDFGVVEYVLYVGVLNGVAHEFVVGDRAAAAHCVVGSYLVLLDLFRRSQSLCTFSVIVHPCSL